MKRTALLLPGQVEVILNPGCKSKSGDYYKCSQNAYRSSAMIDPETKNLLPTPGGCGDPEERRKCAKGDWLYKTVEAP